MINIANDVETFVSEMKNHNIIQYHTSLSENILYCENYKE